MLNNLSIDEVRQTVTHALAEALSTQTSPWFGTEAAATYLGCTPGTMKTWRSRGEGPKYHIIQEKLVRYHVSDLDAFVRGEVAR